MSKYTCELCQKSFSQKNDYNRHITRKTACVKAEKIIEITKTQISSKGEISILTTIFRNCLDILRDNEHIIGDKALKNLAYLLILKLIEPKIGNEIDFENYEYDFSEYGTDIDIIEHKKKLMKLIRFTNLAKETKCNYKSILIQLWDDILSQHEKTKDIFIEKKGFDIQNDNTYKLLIEEINDIDFENISVDIQGIAYENIIKDTLTGKVLGQFFTPPELKKMMVNIIKPRIKDDGTIETIYDPAMGTGGFLITAVKHIIAEAKVKKIDLNWKNISESIGGTEAQLDTFQLAKANMLISSGHVFTNIHHGDSIRKKIEGKYDIILANPPFGIKGLNYDEIKAELKNDYLPIKTKNAVSLFLQVIINILNKNGRCAVVLPDGQDLFGKDTTLITIREYLMKTCNLKEIYYLPSGVFEYTPIKTCIFYFVKKVEGTDVLTIEPKTKGKKQEKNGEYKFSKTHQTHSVKFYDYDPKTETKNLLIEVPIQKIADNSYSLNYAEYLEDKTENEKEYSENVEIKRLNELFYIKKGSLQSSKNIEGKYTFITASDENKTHNSYTHNCECVLLVGGAEGSLAKAHYYNGKFIASDLLYILIAKNQNEINYKYIWYYLNFNREKHISDKKICCGTPKKSISLERCSNIKIPIPSLERQNEIVEYLDFIYEKANKTSEEKISELKKLNEYCLTNQKKFGENEIKTLGSIIKSVKTGKDVVATDRKKGQYPFYGANGIIDYVDNYKFDGRYLLTARTGSLGSLHITNGKFWCSGDVHRIEFPDNNLLSYVYYYLQTIDFQKFRTGVAHPKLSGSNLKSIKIPIPSLERQKEIVEYCEKNDALIKELESEIEDNKQKAKEFMSSALQSSHIDEESEETQAIEDNESSDEEEHQEHEEITYKKKTYYKIDNKVYIKNEDESLGDLFAIYNEETNKLEKV